MDIEMFGQLLPEQANAPDSVTTYGFAGPVTGTLPPLLSRQLIPNLGHAIKGPYSRTKMGVPSPPHLGGIPDTSVPFLGIGPHWKMQPFHLIV